jgi:DNA-binding transcriptional regulator YdaS (Cro superfamily)
VKASHSIYSFCVDIEYLGCQHKLAAACGVSQALISKAKIDGRLSARLAIAIHRATAGAVPGSALRPDLWRSPEHVPVNDVPDLAPGPAS